MWVLYLSLLIAPFASQQLEQCINEYNSLLQQCQTEINRAGSQVNAVVQQLDEQNARVSQLEADQVGLFSWSYARRHVEHVFPEMKGVAIIPNEYWTHITPIVDQQIRPRIAPFMAHSPPEDILLFSSLVSLALLRFVLFVFSFSAAAKCPVSGKN